MMSESGIVIRLIDVVLILLFGFISISEISSHSPIDLPKSTEMEYLLPDSENLLVVGITPEGQFLIEDEMEQVTDFNSLKNYILMKKAENDKKSIETRVRIRSNWNTPIKYTIAVADFCDDFHIPKGMDVVLKK